MTTDPLVLAWSYSPVLSILVIVTIFSTVFLAVSGQTVLAFLSLLVHFVIILLVVKGIIYGGIQSGAFPVGDFVYSYRGLIIGATVSASTCIGLFIIGFTSEKVA